MISLKDVIASQDRSDQYYPILFWKLAVPLAWPITFVMCNLGIGPNLATGLRFVLSIFAFAVISFSGPEFYAAGIAMLFLAILMDNVDGQLARIRDAASFFGKMFDGVADSVIEVGTPFVISLHVFAISGDTQILIFGAIASLCHALMQLVMVRSGLMRATYQLTSNGSPKPHDTLSKFLQVTAVSRLSDFFQKVLPLLLWDIRVGGLILCVALGEEAIFVVLMMIVQVLALSGLTIFRLLDTYIELDVHRRSNTSAAKPNLKETESAQ